MCAICQLTGVPIAEMTVGAALINIPSYFILKAGKRSKKGISNKSKGCKKDSK